MPLGFPQNLKAKTLNVAGETVLSGGVKMTSTTNGFVVPRMNDAARANLSNLVNGTIIYNTDNERFEGYANGSWSSFDVTAV